MSYFLSAKIALRLAVCEPGSVFAGVDLAPASPVWVESAPRALQIPGLNLIEAVTGRGSR